VGLDTLVILAIYVGVVAYTVARARRRGSC
jgi:hypothetical protein